MLISNQIFGDPCYKNQFRSQKSGGANRFDETSYYAVILVTEPNNSKPNDLMMKIIPSHVFYSNNLSNQ